MTLPASVPRDELHFRHIVLRGFRRADGLYDIEARLVDTKTEEMTVEGGHFIARGAPVHDMSVRLVIDEGLNVLDVMASTDASPYGICRDATKTLQCLKGLVIGRGWSKAIRERLAGRNGCTHLTELLNPLATVAFQTLWTVRRHQPPSLDADGNPRKIDSCFAYASEREIVRQRWPAHYKGVG